MKLSVVSVSALTAPGAFGLAGRSTQGCGDGGAGCLTRVLFNVRMGGGIGVEVALRISHMLQMLSRMSP